MLRWQPGSVRNRLRLALLILLPLILGATAFVLDQAFERSQRAAVEARLRVLSYVLLGAAEAGGGQLWMPPSLQEPRFDQPGSGLYGWVEGAGGRLLWRSGSAVGQELYVPATQQPFGETPAGKFFFAAAITWETEDGRETPFRFVVLEEGRTLRAEQRTFRALLWGGLGLLALLLLIAQSWLVRWGLAPLEALAKDIGEVEEGRQSRLSGVYPVEVQPVTENLNRLLETERRQRERYRLTLADLAHSLKTPLAVVRNLRISPPAAAADLNEQLERMEQIVAHQLGRSVIQQAQPSLMPVPVRAAVERLGGALQKIYAESRPVLDVEGEGAFRGDERDLLELLGNLLDNAFKYGAGKVLVRIAQQSDRLQLRIEDNGPGVPSELRSAILNRGSRADQQPKGQGIGLAVTRDIVASYDGRLQIESSAMGGAAFVVSLPGALLPS